MLRKLKFLSLVSLFLVAGAQAQLPDTASDPEILTVGQAVALGA